MKKGTKPQPQPENSRSHNNTTTDVAKPRRGRPAKFNKQQLASIKVELDEFISTEDDPTLAKFIARSEWNLNKDNLSGNKYFSDSMKKLVNKQESFLLSQMKNPTMAIFRLKQPIFGYTDKSQLETQNLHVFATPDPELSKAFTAFIKKKTSISTSKPVN